MTLYTIMPHEHVHPHQHEALTAYFEIMYNGIPVMVEHDGGTMLRIDRILSTDPAHFLQESVQPGQSIPLFEMLNN
ncbi:YlzJ-like family protein [Peribacillus asahii]|uniref:Uncharacterized protein n=1 Tax=Peribacillus asahii TaxID=228899 RepID=A0A3T0KQ20_9BACI|nr:YlzJ-like family protein [Peribacillus asahii]AZV42331.1 hypothetical protein BAOM_1721 [Peribacillus asahii]USK86637.1 YlzJ-like family protein [Peribacillus asahii]